MCGCDVNIRVFVLDVSIYVCQEGVNICVCCGAINICVFVWDVSIYVCLEDVNTCVCYGDFNSRVLGSLIIEFVKQILNVNASYFCYLVN